MGIEALISRASKQKAVYWGSPVANGTGGYTYDDAVEIDCRWVNKVQVLQNANGENIVSNAVIYVNEDLDEQGMLYLGTLNDLDSDPNPIDSGAREIKMIDKIPDMNGVEYLRKVYL